MTFSRALRRSGILVGLILLFSACAGVDSRIAKNRTAYESWPMAVREKVAAGQIDLGFTREQVEMALGEPDRVSTLTDANGVSQVWSYRDRTPRFGIGLGIGVGFGSWGRHGGSVGGVGIGTGTGLRDNEKLAIVFDPGGAVSAIEVRGK